MQLLSRSFSQHPPSVVLQWHRSERRNTRIRGAAVAMDRRARVQFCLNPSSNESTGSRGPPSSRTGPTTNRKEQHEALLAELGRDVRGLSADQGPAWAVDP